MIDEEVPDVKHHRSLFRALSALLCLVLCTQLTACGQKDTFSPASGKRYDDSLITEAISKEGSFTDEHGQEWDYSYHIPQLADDTADAESINKAIMNILSGDAQATLSSSSVTKMPETHYADISWQSHWNGSLLSLSLHLTGWASDSVSYEVYHYDFASGRRLTNAQLLDRFEIDVDDFTAALRRAAAQTFDSIYAPWNTPGLSSDSENFGSMCIELASMRAWTIAEGNYELDTLLFYLDGDNSFTAFQPVGSVAGANWYYREMSGQIVPNEWADGKAPRSDYSFVSAVLTGEGAAIRFTRQEDGMFDSEEYRPYVGFSYNTDYPIAACYGEYQDIFVGTFGNGMAPYVFLLTKDGTVEYADIFGGFDNGFLCSGGPLYGLHDIARFENGEREGGYEEGYQTVYAVDQSGDRYDLAGRITPMANAMPFPATGDWYAEVRHGVDGGGSYTSSFFLSFSKNGFTSIENFMEDMEDLSIDYGGYCTYLGMTEQGMIYLFNLYNSNDDVRGGTFLLDFYNSENDLLRIIPVSGVNLFDAAEDGSTTFVRAYG